MTGRARRTGRWLLVPLRHGVSLRLLVALALLSTVTSVLLGLGLGGPAWADDAGSTGGSGSSSTPSGEDGDDFTPGCLNCPGSGYGAQGGSFYPGSTDEEDDQDGGQEQFEPGPITEPPADEEEETAQEEFDRLVQEQQEADALNRGVLSAFDVRDRNGAPVSTYQVYATTGDWDDWDLKIKDCFTQGAFTVTVWMISFTCWLVAWALAFSLAGLLFRPVLSIATNLHSNVLVQMGLPSLFLAVAMFVAGWHFMFGSRARGWGEAAAALTVSALAVGALVSPPDLLLNERDGVVGRVQQLAIEVVSLTVSPHQDVLTPQEEHAMERAAVAGEEVSRTPSLPDAPDEVTRLITDALVDAFIARPSQLLSYGQTFQGRCAEDFELMQVRQRVFESELDKRMNPDEPVGNFVEGALRDVPGIGGFLGDWFQDRSGADLVGDDAWFDATVEDEWQEILGRGPIEEFEEGGEGQEPCVENAEAAKRASWDKVGGAFFALLAAIIAAVFVLLLIGAFLSAQFWLAVEAVLAKLALVIGVLPGIGRSWLMGRATEIGRRLLLMIVSAGSLGVFIVIITELVNAPEEQIPGGVTTRFVVIDIACVARFVFRRRLTAAAGNVARRARDRIDRSSIVGDTTGASSGSGFRSGLGRGGGALGRAAWLAAAVSTGGGAAVARTLLRAPAKLAVGSVVNAGRTAGVMARGIQIGGRGASAAGRAIFTQAGRAGMRQNIQGATARIVPNGPATAALLRARIAGRRAAAARRAASPAHPVRGMWAPAGARPAARIGGPAVPGPRGGRRRGPAGRAGTAPGRSPQAAVMSPVHGGGGSPAGPAPVVVSPTVAAMRRRAARVQARRQAAAPRRGGAPGPTPPGALAPTPPIRPIPPVSPRRGGRPGGGGTP